MKYLLYLLCAIVLSLFLYNRNQGFLLELVQRTERRYKDELEEWIARCEKIYDECGIAKPLRIEASNKISKKRFNTHRYSLYIPSVPINKVTYVVRLMKAPKKYQGYIAKKIRDNNREIIYGVDLSQDCARIYLNKDVENVILQARSEAPSVIAYEWSENEIAIKSYNVVTHTIMNKELHLRFDQAFISAFLEILPENLWEHTCIKYDTREDDIRPCAFYLSCEYSPTLGQIESKLRSMIKMIYDGDMKDMDVWFDDYRECTISWFVLTNKKGKVELSLYFNTNGRILDLIENRLYGIYC